MAANARPRSARTSVSVDREERTRGAVDRALEVEVMGQIVPALRVSRPVRTDAAHVLPQQHGRLEGRARAALLEFPSPVLPLQRRQCLPRPLHEVTGVRGVHAVSLPWMTTAGTIRRAAPPALLRLACRAFRVAGAGQLHDVVALFSPASYSPCKEGAVHDDKKNMKDRRDCDNDSR